MRHHLRLLHRSVFLLCSEIDLSGVLPVEWTWVVSPVLIKENGPSLT